MKLDHVGIAVESLETALPIFERLFGTAPLSIETVEEQGVRVAVFAAGESRIELLEATARDSPVARFVKKRGAGIHHLTLAVPSLRDALRKLENDGIQSVDREPRSGAEGRKIAFLHPKTTAGILIELTEEAP